MKRISAVLLTLIMILGCVSVSAYDPVWDDFAAACRYEGNANIKMTVKVDGEGQYLESNGLSSLLGSSLDYDMNVLSNAEQTKAQADGKITLNSADEKTVPSSSFDLWLDLNMDNEEDFKYILILKALDSGIGNAVGDKYLYFDYSKVPGYKDLMMELIPILKSYSGKTLSEMLQKTSQSSRDKILSAMDEVKPVYSDGTYTLTLSETQLKKLASAYVGKLTELMDEESVKNFASETLIDWMNRDDVHLFNSDKAIVLSVKTDGKLSEFRSEINLDTNFYDIAKILNPNDPTLSLLDRERFGAKLNITLDGSISPLPDDYSIDYPEITDSNSIDVFALSANTDFPAASIGIIPDNAAEDVKIMYENTRCVFENKPVVVKDRTFLPLRELANMFGIDNDSISYDDATEEVRINGGGVEIVMNIGSRDTYINGEKKELDVPAFTVNDRTYIPVRFVSEMFGKNVDYSEDENGLTVFIND